MLLRCAEVRHGGHVQLAAAKETSPYLSKQIKRIKDEITFRSVEELRRQIEIDVEKIRACIKIHHGEV